MLLLYKDKILKRIAEEYPRADVGLVRIVLFGSAARGAPSPLSDIDLLLVTENPRETRRLFSPFRASIYAETAVPITALYVTPDQYENSPDPLYKTIKQEGKILWAKEKTRK